MRHLEQRHRPPSSAQRFRKHLLPFLGVAALLLILTRLLKFVLARRLSAMDSGKYENEALRHKDKAQAYALRQPYRRAITPPMAPSALASKPAPASRPRPARPAATSAPRSRVKKQAASPTPSRLRWENVLLAFEVGAVLLLLLAGAALWQTRREVNDAYRKLQGADPGALPTLIAAAVPQGPVQQQDEMRQIAGPPALPTPFPTVTPIAAASAAPETSAAREPAAIETEDEDAPAQWGMTAIMARLDDENEQARRLQIPAIGVDAFVFHDYGDDWLKLGVVQIGQPAIPGQPGNLVLAAHNDIYGEIFRDLDKLQPGDELYVLGPSSGYTYRVRETIIVEPDEVWVTLPTPGPTVTLVSCYPYLIGSQRIVVFADYAE